MDFLSRLLQKDPMRRISYEDLFSHPYPDLIHAPCAESHQTAIRIVTDAIHHDRENNSRRAFSLYCEALNYLIPLAYGKQKTNKITGTYKRIDIDLKYLCVPPCAESYQTAIRIVTDAIHHDRENNSRRVFSLYCEALNYLIPLAYGEADATRKKELYSKVEEYRRRAQQLASKHQPLPVITTNSTHSHTSLHVLAEAIPNLKSGLEIGETGDMYLAEGNYELALEKLKASLAILIQFCEAETSSSQLKPLLAHQVCECKLILGLFRR
ncbi:serine/threonine-protein kinase ULK3-like isoform X2 [Diaphorina citri]|nr:serine/threonine-protein kinase ULK3-like isoform X2 [Diaphorina citri]